MIPNFDTINESALEGIRNHLERLKVILCTGGLSESAELALKDSIAQLEEFLEREKQCLSSSTL